MLRLQRKYLAIQTPCCIELTLSMQRDGMFDVSLRDRYCYVLHEIGRYFSSSI